MITKIKKELKKIARVEKAKVLMRFFKTGPGEYGEGDKFLGVVVPDIRKVVKKFWAEATLSDVEDLLHSSWHEERLAALLILVEKYKHEDEKVKKQIFQLYLRNIKKYINNWDLVDLTTPNIVGAHLMDKDRGILYKMAKSRNLWEKRVSILATFYYIYRGDAKDTIKIAEILLHDNHDLIHKSVGWMLREVGKRCTEIELENFLKKHASVMPRTMLRYAIERLPENRRLFWLNLEKNTK